MKTKLKTTLALFAAFCGLQLFTATPAMAEETDPAANATVAFDNTDKSYDTGVANFQDTETWKITIPASDTLPAGSQVRVTSVSFGLNSSDDTLNVKKLKITVSGADVFSGLANGTGEKQTSTKMSDGSFKQKYDFGAEGSDNECILSVGTAYTFALVDANGSPVLQRCCCKKTNDAANSPVKQDTSLQDYRISQYIEAELLSAVVYCSYIEDRTEWWSDVTSSSRVTKGGASATWEDGKNLELTAKGASSALEAANNKNIAFLFLVGSTDTSALSIMKNFTINKAYIGIPLSIKANSVKLSGFNLSGRGSLTFDATANGYTIDDTTKSTIRTATDKVNFKGSGNNGITLNYGTSMSAALSSHLIFDGGTHAFTYGMGSADQAFSTTGTLDNPTILVKDGTTLNYTMKDMNGWNGSRKDGAIVRVASGATMNILPDANKSMFMSGRLVLEPGSTTTYKTGTDSNGFCVYGGVDTSKAQIYVPSPASGAVNTVATLSKHADSSKNLTFGKASGTGGAAITVDANATLQINGPISGGQQVSKGGTGTLVLNGDTSGYTGNFHIDSGVVELTNNTGYNFNIPDRKLKGTLRIASDAKYTAKAGDSVNYDGNGNVEVYGALDMSDKRWTYKSSNKLYVYAGATISGTGDQHGAIDYNQGNTLYAKDSTSENKTATISAPTKLQGAMTFAVDEGVTLAMSGTINYANSQTHTKNGAGTLVLSGTQTNPGNASWTISAGTLALPNSNASGLNKITINSGAVLEPARGITIPTVDGNGQIYAKLTDEETGGTSESLTLFTCASKADTVSVFVTDSQGRQYAVTVTDNNYIVNPKSPKGVAKIVETETEYQTVAAALAAVTSGQTVQLLADNEEALSTAATCTLDLNGHSFNGTLQINEGGVITMSGTSFTKDFNRYMLTNTTGDGTLRLNAGSTNIEVASAGDTSPLVANVNIEYLGTCELQYVGTLGENDKFIVSAGKTVTFANGSICPMRNELVVNGTVIAKNILIGHYSDGDYPGKVSINAGGSVKAETVSFRNAGGTDSDANRSVLEVTGTLELTKSDAAALTKTAGAKNVVKLNGGTIKAETASWYTSGDINITAVGGTTTTVSAAADKTANLSGQFTGTGALVADGAGTVLLSADAQPVTVSEETTFKFQLTAQLQMNGVVASNVTFEDESVTGITFVKTDGTEVAGVGVNNNEFKPILPSGILRYGYAFNGNRDKETEASASISMSGGSASAFEDGFNPPEKAMKFEAGQNYGDSFNFGGGDFTIIAVVKAPTDENRCIFGLGGQSGTAGMLGMARMTGNNIKIFTKNGTELMTVEVADATTKYHTYALRYIKATNKLALSVDFGAYGNEVSFTANTSDAKFQFGGVHGGCPSGISNASNGDIDEFRLYTAQLSVEAVKQAAAPFVPSYEATIPADATGTLTFSTLPWFPATTTVYANRSWTVINRATADVTTVSVDGDAAKTKLTVVSATKVLKFGSPSKLNASAYDFSQAPGGVGFGVTGGWTVPDALKNYIRDNETKIIFDSTNSGATLDYGAQSVAFKSHLVFEGGTHKFTYSGGANKTFAVNGTDANPTLLVKNGTTLTFQGHDLGGYNGKVNVAGVVKIENGGRVDMQCYGSGTCFFRQRIIIVPGGVFNIDGMGNDFCMQGGTDEATAQIVVPAGSGTALITGTSASDAIYLHREDTQGFAISVGEGSTLDIQSKIANIHETKNQEIKKYGTGTLKLSGDISDFWNNGQDCTVKLSVIAGALDLATANAVKCTIWTGVPMSLTGNGTVISGVIDGTGSLVRNGSGIVTLTGANTYSGGTTVTAGTLKVAEGASIGSGNYSVAEGATLDLPSTFRPADAKLIGTSQGTVGITLTSEEQAKFDNEELVSLISVDGTTFAGTIKVYDLHGTEYTLESVEVVDGKIQVQKEQDAKVSPFHVANPAPQSGNWTDAAWLDSSDEPKSVESDDWKIKVDAIITNEAANVVTLTADRGIELGVFSVTNAGTLAVSAAGANTIEADSIVVTNTGTFTVSGAVSTLNAIDDSASTGATTLDFATGSANVTAGANTIVRAGGTGTLTIGAGKMATITNGVWAGTISLPTATSTLKYAGTTALAQIPYVASDLSGTLELACPITAVGNEGRISGTKTMVFDEGFTLSDNNLVLGNEGGVTQNYTQKGGTITLTKEESAETATTSSALVFGHWNSTTTYNLVGGTISVPNGQMVFGWDGKAAVTVGGGDSAALLSVKGIRKGQSNKECSLTIKDNGTVEIGANGLYVNQSNKTLVLNGGTLKFTTTQTPTMTTGISLTKDSTILAANGTTLTLGMVLSGDYGVTFGSADATGTIVLTGANTYTGATTVEGGTLKPSVVTTGGYLVKTGASAEFDIDTTVTDYAKPTITELGGTVTLRAMTTTLAVSSGKPLSIATLPPDTPAEKVTATLIDKDTLSPIATDTTIDPTTGNVTVKLHADNFTLTPLADTDFTWALGDAGSLFDGSKKWTDFGNVAFNTTTFTNAVTLPSKINASNIKLGGTYNFSGSPLVANEIDTATGAVATFANDVVATSTSVTNGSVKFASLATDSVAVTNATLEAGVLGRSMRYVRLTITKVQEVSGKAADKPAVAEFRLYRGNPTVGYTRLDWPVGTKISDNNTSDGSMGNVTTKETAGYPTPGGVGAGTGERGGNEIQPGTLIDGYYYGVTTTNPYGTTSTGNDKNKWWPTSKGSQPWIVQIEFPYPVAIFAGCNFCLADVAYRNPVSWTIDVSLDGQNWTTVNTTVDATWTSQNAWRRPDDLPEGKAAEDWPAFVNNVDPTVVDVNNSTIVADGSWSADLRASGNLVFKGVAGKKLTLDAASRSAFDPAAHLKFDLNAYDVSAAGKQYVVAGPTTGWPEVEDITVEPSTFSLYKDAEGYYVVVESGNYWVGDQEGGVGTWDFRNTKAWATNATETKKSVWLNDVPAFFTRNATVTIAEDQDLQPTAINVTSNDDIAVTFAGDLTMFETLPITVGSTNVTITLDNDEDLTPSVAVVDGAAPNFVKTGDGTMTIASGRDFKQGTLTVREGTNTVGSATTINTFATVTAEGSGVIDINGKGADAGRAYTLGTGGSLVNNGSAISSNSRQMHTLVVGGNATIGGMGDFGLVTNSWKETALTLGANTLIKTGTNTFWLCGTTVTGDGTIDLQEGKIDTVYASGTTTIPGTLKIGAGTEFLAKGTVNVGAIDVAEGGALNNTGTIGDFTLTGKLTVGSTGTYGTITLADGDAVATIGTRRDLTFSGTGKVNVTLTDSEVQGGAELTLFAIGSGTPSVGTVTYNDLDITSKCTIKGNKITLDYEAKAGTKYYLALAEAISGATEGDTVTMLKNVEIASAIAVTKSLALEADANELSGSAGFEISAEKTLMVKSGHFVSGSLAKSGTGSLVIMGGRFQNNTLELGTTESHYVAIEGAGTGESDYKYQVVPGEEPTLPATGYTITTSTGTGVVALNAAQVTALGLDPEKATSAEVSNKLKVQDKNDLTKYENLVLGLDGEETEYKDVPYPAPVQGTSTTQVSLKLGSNVSVDTTTGAKVTYKVKTKGATGSYEYVQGEWSYDATATLDLPTTQEGVKYYKFDVIVTPAK